MLSTWEKGKLGSDVCALVIQPVSNVHYDYIRDTHTHTA